MGCRGGGRRGSTDERDSAKKRTSQAAPAFIMARGMGSLEEGGKNGEREGFHLFPAHLHVAIFCGALLLKGADALTLPANCILGSGCRAPTWTWRRLSSPARAGLLNRPKGSWTVGLLGTEYLSLKTCGGCRGLVSRFSERTGLVSISMHKRITIGISFSFGMEEKNGFL